MKKTLPLTARTYLDIKLLFHKLDETTLPSTYMTAKNIVSEVALTTIEKD